MTDNQLLILQALIGQVLPPVNDIINKHIKNDKVRFLASVLVSIGVSVAFNYKMLMVGSLDAFLTSALVLWTSSQAAYRLYYKDSRYQNNIRFNSSPIPLKEVLTPPIPGK